MDLRNYLSSTERIEQLASAIGTSPNYVRHMKSGRKGISPQRANAIEAATGGAVTRQELRPNDWQEIWPELVAGNDG